MQIDRLTDDDRLALVPFFSLYNVERENGRLGFIRHERDTCLEGKDGAFFGFVDLSLGEDHNGSPIFQAFDDGVEGTNTEILPIGFNTIQEIEEGCTDFGFEHVVGGKKMWTYPRKDG